MKRLRIQYCTAHTPKPAFHAQASEYASCIDEIIYLVHYCKIKNTINLSIMKEHVTGVLAATALAFPLALAAQETPAPAAPHAANTELLQVSSAAVKEIQHVLDGKDTLARKLERLSDFRHAPDTAARLNAIFGNERPWSLERNGAGTPGYRWTLQPLRYTAPGGGLLEWSDFPVELSLDKSGKQLAFRGTWASFGFTDESGRVEMRDAAISGSQRQGNGLFWVGTMQGHIASVDFDLHKPQPVKLALRELWMRSDVRERPKAVDYTQSFGIKALEVAGHQIDDLTFAYRVANVDKAALNAFYLAEQKLSAQGKAKPDAADLDALLPLFKQFARTASKNKTVLRIDEISASYHGQKAVLRGSVGMAGVTEADLKDFAGLAKRVDARFELRVPVALLREVATAIAQQQAQAQAAQGGAAPDVAKTAQDMTDAIVGKVLGNGYAKLENDVLVAPLSFRGGVLRVNGKVVDLPKPPQQPKQPKQPQPVAAAAAPEHFMQARRVSDSCTLPDYPAAVVEGDKPLTASLQFSVEADGGLRGLRLAQSSGYPDYDAALLQAFGTCRFIPALRAGKPVAHADTFTLAREPGSARP